MELRSMSNNILDKLLKSIVRKLQIFYLKNELSENIFDRNDVSNFAFNSIIQSRGKDKPPALIIHGVRHRSGTVFAGEILRLHPDLYAYPNEIWEIPFLKCSNDLLLFQDNFFEIYRPNKNKIGENDFQSIFGSAFISYLYSFAPEGKRLLLKTPWVENLNLFFTYFPNENLICLLRDGRDVVHSTIKTWGKKNSPKFAKAGMKAQKRFLPVTNTTRSFQIDIYCSNMRISLEAQLALPRRVVKHLKWILINFQSIRLKNSQ